MKLDNIDILKLLPLFMRDKFIVSLSMRINRLLSGVGGKVPELKLWDQLDQLDDERLDELAWELNIEWYQRSLPIKMKLGLVKSSDKVHSTMGTKWAVETVLNTIFPGTTVSEGEDEILTYKQFESYMKRYMEERSKQPVMSSLAAAWEEAQQSGFVKDGRPAAFIRRDEAIALFRRKDQTGVK